MESLPEFNVLDSLERDSKICVVGDRATGKTNLLKYILSCAWRKKDSDSKAIVCGKRKNPFLPELVHYFPDADAVLEDDFFEGYEEPKHHTVFAFEGVVNVPMLRGTEHFVVATSKPGASYWCIDNTLDPNLVFVFAPKSPDTVQACRSVFVNLFPKKVLDEAFEDLKPFEALVVNFDDKQLYRFKAPRM